ncbi:MAG TPA: hypothetical protein P5523_04975 [Bacteroidales bacterium]|nr:hypothetical protein [Bacteroidales bacterium]
MSTLISCGYLSTVQAKADQIFSDPVLNNDAIADVESAKAVLEQQQGVIRMPSITGTKNKELRVEWLTKCSPTTSACSDDCSISGEDATAECKDYELECLRETSFKVNERAYRDRTIEKVDAVAFNMVRHMAAMDEYVAQYILAQLVANAGTNLFTGGVGDVNGTTTYIAPQYWDDAIWGYFNQVVRLNKFRNPYLITGNNLYQLLFNRPLEAGNADGSGNFRKMNTLKVYQDPENVETVASGQSILIHKGAAAFLTKAWNPLNAANAVEPAPGYFLWSEPSRNLPGVVYDIIMKQACESNDFSEAYKIQLHGLFAMNPYPCDDDNTGILVFECGTAPLN